MTPETRLKAIGALLTLSTVYALLVGVSPALARTVALGYIAVTLTIIAMIICWKKPL
jgi:hypothetical protein